jgi:hypothetical protein
MNIENLSEMIISTYRSFGWRFSTSLDDWTIKIIELNYSKGKKCQTGVTN